MHFILVPHSLEKVISRFIWFRVLLIIFSKINIIDLNDWASQHRLEHVNHGFQMFFSSYLTRFSVTPFANGV